MSCHYWYFVSFRTSDGAKLFASMPADQVYLVVSAFAHLADESCSSSKKLSDIVSCSLMSCGLGKKCCGRRPADGRTVTLPATQKHDVRRQEGNLISVFPNRLLLGQQHKFLWSPVLSSVNCLTVSSFLQARQSWWSCLQVVVQDCVGRVTTVFYSVSASSALGGTWSLPTCTKTVSTANDTLETLVDQRLHAEMWICAGRSRNQVALPNECFWVTSVLAHMQDLQLCFFVHLHK